jgi:transposase
LSVGRRWSRDDKMRIIEETLAPGAVVTEIARLAA